ncbi:hypothetical protein [Oceanobacillus oncorhynchi]|uniref:hypothetical protein n=1 Tax=Oceanobacillus oncorhynchi TaxID=545501 RepID=UPI0018675291|nr:hypothetical protein [Oceanobacillus oncorhynchi]
MTKFQIEEYIKNLELPLNFLKTEIKKDHINQIIKEHQIKFNFETATKINDGMKSIFNSGNEAFRIYKEIKYGGTCFANTLILLDVFKSLELETEYIFLEPDHFALALKLKNIWYYVDVSFWAPLFQLYPLQENWEVNFNGLRIGWNYNQNTNEGILLRNRYPAKKWGGDFASNDLFYEKWEISINKKSFFNTTVCINKWLDQKYFACFFGREFKLLSGEELIHKEVFDEKTISNKIIDVFNINPDKYVKAMKKIEARSFNNEDC